METLDPGCSRDLEHDWFCPFCYKKVTTESSNQNSKSKIDSSQSREKDWPIFQRYLNINGDEIFTKEGNGSLRLRSCEDCSFLLDKCCHLYYQMECLKMEFDWRLRTLMQIMTCAEKVKMRVKDFQNHLKQIEKLETDEKEVEKKGVRAKVVGFRKAFVQKVAVKLDKSGPRVRLERYGAPLLQDKSVEQEGLRRLEVVSGECREVTPEEIDSESMCGGRPSKIGSIPSRESEIRLKPCHPETCSAQEGYEYEVESRSPDWEPGSPEVIEEEPQEATPEEIDSESMCGGAPSGKEHFPFPPKSKTSSLTHLNLKRYRSEASSKTIGVQGKCKVGPKSSKRRETYHKPDSVASDCRSSTSSRESLQRYQPRSQSSPKDKTVDVGERGSSEAFEKEPREDTPDEIDSENISDDRSSKMELISSSRERRRNRKRRHSGADIETDKVPENYEIGLTSRSVESGSPEEVTRSDAREETAEESHHENTSVDRMSAYGMDLRRIGAKSSSESGAVEKQAEAWLKSFKRRKTEHGIGSIDSDSLSVTSVPINISSSPRITRQSGTRFEMTARLKVDQNELSEREPSVCEEQTSVENDPFLGFSQEVSVVKQQHSNTETSNPVPNEVEEDRVENEENGNDGFANAEDDDYEPHCSDASSSVGSERVEDVSREVSEDEDDHEPIFDSENIPETLLRSSHGRQDKTREVEGRRKNTFPGNKTEETLKQPCSEGLDDKGYVNEDNDNEPAWSDAASNTDSDKNDDEDYQHPIFDSENIPVSRDKDLSSRKRIPRKVSSPDRSGEVKLESTRRMSLRLRSRPAEQSKGFCNEESKGSVTENEDCEPNLSSSSGKMTLRQRTRKPTQAQSAEGLGEIRTKPTRSRSSPVVSSKKTGEAERTENETSGNKYLVPFTYDEESKGSIPTLKKLALEKFVTQRYKCRFKNCYRQTKGSFFNKLDFLNHSRLHGSFKCRFCQKRETYAPDLIKHEWTHTCSEPTRKILESNERLKYGERLKCTRCDFNSDWRLVIGHFTSKHLNLEPSRQTCPICNYFLTDNQCTPRKDFLRHFKAEHDLAGVNHGSVKKCRVDQNCKAFFLTAKGLEYHCSKSHGMDTGIKENYKESRMRMSFSLIKRVKSSNDSKENQTEKKQITLMTRAHSSECRRSIPSLKELALENITMQKYSCTFQNCSSKKPSFFNRQDLVNHMKLHGSFKCNFCDFTEPYGPNLIKHEWEHHCDKLSTPQIRKGGEGYWFKPGTRIKCSRCEYESEWRVVATHFTTEHLKLTPPRKETCPICASKLSIKHGTAKAEFLRHFKLEHDLGGIAPNVASEEEPSEMEMGADEVANDDENEWNEAEGHESDTSSSSSDDEFEPNCSPSRSGRRPCGVREEASSLKRRSRTAFTDKQLARLEQEFEKNQYLTKEEQKDLASELSLRVNNIKIWFQNQRRILRKSSGQLPTCVGRSTRPSRRSSKNRNLRKSTIVSRSSRRTNKKLNNLHSRRNEVGRKNAEADSEKKSSVLFAYDEESKGSIPSLKKLALEKLVTQTHICRFKNCTRKKGSFFNKMDFMNHSRLHGTFKCSFCKNMETYAPDLIKHEWTHTCSEPTQKILESNERLKYGERLKCTRCDFNNDWRLVIRHFTTTHLNLEPSRETCPICNYYLTDNKCTPRKDFLQHFKTEHDLAGVDHSSILRCPKSPSCKAFFRTEEGLQYHNFRFHGERGNGYSVSLAKSKGNFSGSKKIFGVTYCRRKKNKGKERTLTSFRSKSKPTLRSTRFSRRVSGLSAVKQEPLDVEPSDVEPSDVKPSLDEITAEGEGEVEELCGESDTQSCEEDDNNDNDPNWSGASSSTSDSDPDENEEESSDLSGKGQRRGPKVRGCMTTESKSKGDVPSLKMLALDKVVTQAYYCQFRNCPRKMSFFNKVDFENHSRLHGSFKCNFCEFTESHAPDLIKHEWRHHCEESIQKLLEHEKVPKYGMSLKCSRCDYENEWRKVVSHFTVFHLKLTPTRETCPICKSSLDKQFTTCRKDFVRHFMAEHDLNRPMHKKKIKDREIRKELVVLPTVREMSVCAEKFGLEPIEHNKVRCGKCRKAIFRQVDLEAHQKLHGKFKCEFCDHLETNAPDLLRHEMKHNSKKVGDQELIACPRCPEVRKEMSFLYDHYLESHFSLKMDWPTCSICEQKIHAIDNREIPRVLFSHFEHLHDLRGVTSPNLIYKCGKEGCNAYFKKELHFTVHKHLHEIEGSYEEVFTEKGVVMFKCKKCETETCFNRQPDFRRHWLSSHCETGDSSKIKCSLKTCSRTFESQAELERHLQTVEEMMCATCGKTFHGKNALGAHQVFHTNEKTGKGRYPCEVCGRICKARKELEIHMLSHTGPESYPFMCSVCPKKLLTEHTLKEHMRTHSGVKPFVCEVCGAAYAHRHNLRGHVNSKHADVMTMEPMKVSKLRGRPSKLKGRKLNSY